MFVFDPLVQGLEHLSQRDLQKAETLFLRVINDPYVQANELSKARNYLNDVRACQGGYKSLNFENYRALARRTDASLDPVADLLKSIYFSPGKTYQDFDREIGEKAPSVFTRLKQLKIPDIISRDKLYQKLEKDGLQQIKIALKSSADRNNHSELDVYRWKTIYRKFIETINPVLLERHMELLQYILETGEISILGDPKLTVLTLKYKWIIESTLKSKWFLLRSYFFKAKSEIESQFLKKDGTRKYWEKVKYKKIAIFEKCGFHEKSIQKFLFSDKLNYKTLDEIYKFAGELDLQLEPRDVSLALRGVDKAKDHIRERGGFLMGNRKVFQDHLLQLGFSNDNSYQVARHAKKAVNCQIAETFKRALKICQEEIYWYRIPSASTQLGKDIEEQCVKHLSTVRIHLFDRGRLNKLLLQNGKPLIRKYLVKTYGENVVNLHCYFRLETIYQYYKLKFFQHHSQTAPSVSELIKISRKDFQPVLLEGYRAFIKKRRLVIPDEVYEELSASKSVTGWEDRYTTTEEKILLRFWFLMDHGVSITQKVIQKGLLKLGADLWEYVDCQAPDCEI